VLLKNKDHTNLILFGYKSSGKTYFGKLFAKQFEKNFVDTDYLVEKIYEKRFYIKLNCRKICQKIGEKGFQELEKEAINSFIDIKNAIISLGGGTILNSENYLLLKKIGILIFLKAEKKVIKQRILKNEIPSFLDPNYPEKSFEEMYQKRKAIYEKLSEKKIILYKKTSDQILNELNGILRMAKTES
jgi:shikimate kinase